MSYSIAELSWSPAYVMLRADPAQAIVCKRISSYQPYAAGFQRAWARAAAEVAAPRAAKRHRGPLAGAECRILPSAIPNAERPIVTRLFRLQNITPKRRTARALLVVLGWLSIWPASSCPLPLPKSVVTIEGHQLTVEIAATTDAIVCGLSHRASLPKDHGMLFVFTPPRPLSFWMKDTQVPLSIAFLDTAGRILSIQEMTPLQILLRYRSPGPASYALEVNQGWFARHDIGVGDRVQLPGAGAP